MKKLLPVILALALFSAMSTGVLANAIDQDSNPKTGNSKVTFSVAPTYTVTIPTTVTLSADTSSYTGALEIKATDVCLEEYESLNVSLTYNGIMSTATTPISSIDYTIALGATPVTSGDVVAVFGPSATGQTVTLNITANKTTYAGDYTDTVLFTIAKTTTQPTTLPTGTERPTEPPTERPTEPSGPTHATFD